MREKKATKLSEIIEQSRELKARIAEETEISVLNWAQAYGHLVVKCPNCEKKCAVSLPSFSDPNPGRVFDLSEDCQRCGTEIAVVVTWESVPQITDVDVSAVPELEIERAA